MRTLTLARCTLAVCASLVLLAGCNGGSSAGPAGSVLTPTASRRLTNHPPCPIPKVWASQLTTNPIVEGYHPNGVAIPCTINTGIASGKAFGAPFGLASDPSGNLYVADVNNQRVVAFTAAGAWVATSNTKPTVQPRGVCVAPPGAPDAGVLGVADRQFGTLPADVEFFTNGLVNNAAPTGWATGVDSTFQWCAFDKAGNFFAVGTNTSTPTAVQEIVYLPEASVNTAAATLIASAISTAPYWVSTYVQNNCSNTNGEVLAVADLTPEIQFFKINPVTGVPGPAASSILPLTAYPAGSNKMDQDAPNKCSTKATIYFADYGGSEVLKTKEYSGAIAVFNGAVPGAVGIATNPTGQE
jgi:hypothetical protein